MWKRALAPLPTRLQLVLAVNPVLFYALSNETGQKCFLLTLKIWVFKVEWIEHPKTSHCTSRYHCGTHQWKWSKLMFFCIAFPTMTRWVYLYLFTRQKQLKKVGLVKHLKKTIFSVLCKITVGPFKKKIGQNSWASERFFYALSNETGHKDFLPIV